MNRVARSVYYFSWYLLILGVWLIVAPNRLLAIFQVPATGEGWIRILGLGLVVIGYYYRHAGRTGLTAFFHMTLRSRLLAFVVLTLLVLFRFVPAVVFLFGLAELGGAAWTWREMRRPA